MSTTLETGPSCIVVSGDENYKGLRGFMRNSIQLAEENVPPKCFTSEEA